MKKLNIGIIGAGNFAGFYLQRFRGTYGMDLSDRVNEIHLVDPNETALNETAEKYEVSLTHKDTSTLPNLDAVMVATPGPQHYETTKEHLENGTPTFLCKPIETDVEKAQKLVDLAEENNVINYCGTQMLHHPAIAEALKYMVDENLKVKSVEIAWKKERGPRVHPIPGITEEEGPHPYSILSKIINSEIQDVYRIARNGEIIIEPGKWNDAVGIKKTGETVHKGENYLLSNIEVAAKTIFKYSNGAVGFITEDFENPLKNRSIEIVGEKQGERFDRDVALHVNLTEVPKKYEGEIPQYRQSIIIVEGCKEQRAGMGEIVCNQVFETPDMVGEQLNDFLTYVRTGEKPFTHASFKDDLNVLTLMERLKSYKV